LVRIAFDHPRLAQVATGFDEGLVGDHSSVHGMEAPVMYEAFAEQQRRSLKRSHPVLPDA